MATELKIFSLKWYLDHNPDVAAAVAQGLVDAFEHFEQYGKAEGRSMGPLFDVDLYLEQNPDVAAAVGRRETTAYDHFMQYGGGEGRAPSALFDEAFYLLHNPDVAAAVQAGAMTAVQHFLAYGQSEPRPFNPSIDLGAYLQANPDIAEAVQNGFISAMEHLMVYGAGEARDLGNGVNLGVFANDSTFQQALSSGDITGALQRVGEVAPFLPTFQPPVGWTPPSDTPIPLDFVPPVGVQLVIPPTVVVPPDVVLPPVFMPPAPPAPTPGGGGGPAGIFEATIEGNVITFVSANLSGDVTVTLQKSGDNIIANFSRGGVTDSVSVSSGDWVSITLDTSAITGGSFKPGTHTVLVLNPEEMVSGITAYTTIQNGVDKSAESGTVLVGAGIYNEQVVIDKLGLQLLGPNAGIDPNNGTRVAEAVIQPIREEPYSDSDVYVLRTTSDAEGSVVKGFTIKGDKTSPHPMQSGISVESTGTQVSNNIVEGFNYVGIWTGDYNEGTRTLVTDVLISNNLLKDILPVSDEIGIGHAIYIQGTVGNVLANVITNSYNGIQIQPYGKAGGNSNLYSDFEPEDDQLPLVQGNEIDAVRRGIYLNYAEEGAPRWVIDDNQIGVAVWSEDTHLGYYDGWQGVVIQTYLGGGGFEITDNRIDGENATTDGYIVSGIRFIGNLTGNTKLISVLNNEISNVKEMLQNRSSNAVWTEGFESYSTLVIGRDVGSIIDVSTETGNFAILGGSENDTIIGGSGSDLLLGGNGNDIVRGDGTPSVEARYLPASYGDDIINGGRGTNILVLGTVKDDIQLGGADTIIVDSQTPGIDIIFNFNFGPIGRYDDIRPGGASDIKLPLENPGADLTFDTVKFVGYSDVSELAAVVTIKFGTDEEAYKTPILADGVFSGLTWSANDFFILGAAGGDIYTGNHTEYGLVITFNESAGGGELVFANAISRFESARFLTALDENWAENTDATAVRDKLDSLEYQEVGKPSAGLVTLNDNQKIAMIQMMYDQGNFSFDGSFA